MTEQLPPIDVGSPVSATNPATEDDTYFDKYVEDKSQKPPSFIDRAYDTARAAYYRDTISGIAEAKEQSGFSTLYPEQYPEKFGYDLKLIEAAKDSTAPSAPMTQAELAQLRNKAYPEASNATDKAADILGGLVGGSASPETFALPAVKGLTALKATSALGSSIAFAEKYLPGMAYRAVDTGLGQAALMATVNPIIQDGRISAGLQREFDPWELALAPVEGFVFGAGLHVGFEAGGKVVGKAIEAFSSSPTSKSMAEGFERRVSERIMERIKETDAGFRAPSDLPPPVVAAGEGNFEVRTLEGQTPEGVSTGTDMVPAAGTLPSTSIATETPRTTRLTASEMLSNMDGALGSGSIDTMRFDAPPKTDELDALIEAGQSREDKQIDRIFGDDAEKVKGLIRRGRIDQVDDIIFEKFGSYDAPEAKEANGIIYGTDNYSIVNTESLKSLRDRLSNLEFAVQDAANGDASMLAKELAWVAPELPDISAPETSHTETQRIAILSLARAIEDMRANNIDPYPILNETVAYTGQRVGGDVDDARLLLDRLSQYAERYMDLGGAKQPAEQPVPVLPPPAVAETPAAGESLVRRGADNNVYLGNLRMQFYPDHVFYIVKDGPDLSIYKDGAFKPNRENEIYASEAIQRGVPKEIANSIANFLDTPKDSQEGAIQDTIRALDNLVKSHLSEKNKQPQASQPPVEPPPPAVAEAQAAAKTIEDIPPENRRAVIPALTPEANALSAPTTEGGPAGIFMFNPTELNVDAKRFQFKEGGDEQGVTNTLKSVSKWDQAKGNQVIVWQDNAGKLFVVDGHQRSGLARRLIESGKEQDIQLPGLLYREADGVSAETVRAIAAVKNIAEGSGSALDGAKVLRSNPELMDGSLPLSAGKSRQAFNLSRLGDEPFRMVINDVVPENYGAVVGERIPNDPARQEAAIKAIARFEPRNEAEAAVLVQRVAQAELAKAEEGAQGSMFGDLESADSTAGEEMRIVGKAIAELKKDKSLFTRVVANADRIEQTGSKIEQEAAADVRNEAELFAKQLASDAYTPGPLRDKLVEAAKELRDGKIEIGEATTRIRSALRAAAKERSAARFGDSEGGMAGTSASNDSAQLGEAGSIRRPAGIGTNRLDGSGVRQNASKGLTAEARREKMSARKSLVLEAKSLMESNPNGLTGAAASKFESIGKKINELGFDLDRELDISKIASPEKRQSTLTPETISVIHQDYMRSKPIYMAISEAANGVRHNADTAVDEILSGKAGTLTPQDFYDNFSQTRGALRSQYGDRIKLYRAEGMQKEKPSKNWATTREFAENFGDKIVEAEVPVENIVAANVGTKGNYHEIIVADPKALGIDVSAKKVSYEPGAEGLDQALIPGVRAVTDADRIALEQGRPLAGGNEPAGGLFDEANTAQGDFLAGPIEDRGMQFRTRGPSYPPAEAARVAEAHDGIIRSLQQQSFDLAAKLGMPLREGRVQGGRYSIGQFDSKFGVSRVRQVGDFLTVAHEAGHALEQRIGGDLTDLMNQHVLELAKLDPAGEGSVSEGFAEWVAKYIMNPAAAMKDAPTFTPRFTEFMNARDPALMDAIVQASNNYNALLTAPTPVQLGASITSVEPQGWFRGLIQSYKESGLAPTIGRVLADAYTSVLDAYDPLTRATRDLTRLIYNANGKEAVDLSAGQRPDVLMRMWFARSAQGAAYQLRYGIVPDRGVAPNGPSLHDAISVATGEPGLLGRWDSGKVDEFGLFLAIKRAEVLIDRYKAGDFGERYPLPDNWTSGNVQNAKAALVAEKPQYEQAAQMVHDFTQQLLKKQFDGGIIDRELYDKLSETPFYVPMFRDVADKPMSAPTLGASPDGPGMTDTIKTLRGSSRDIINPLQGIMQQTFLVERTLRHNDVIRSFVDLATRAGAPAGFLVEPVPAREVRAMSFDVRSSIERLAKESGIPEYDAELLMSSINNVFGEDPLLGTMFKNAPTKKRGEPIVFYKEAGELKAVRLMSGKEGMAIYEAMMSLPTAGKDIAAQVMQAAGNIQRAGIVFEPTFMISNLVRDQMAVSILRPDYIPFWDGAKGVWSEATHDEAARLYGYFGGQSAGGAVNEAVGMSVDASLNDLARKSWIQQRTKNPLAFIEGTQISEAGTRNSIFAKVYEQKLSAGMSPYEAAMEAAWAGTDILDFSRHGSKTFLIRQLTPFWNANVQALDKARRTMIEPLYRAAKGDVLTVQEKQDVANAYMAMFKAAAVGSALGAIWAAVNNEDEIYRDADPKRKASHLVFSAGGKEYDVPKPFELSLGFTLGEQAFAALYDKDPRAAGNFVTAAWEMLIPAIPVVGNPLIKSFYESATGVDTYTGRDIVPENMQKFNETPHLQFNERTAPLAVGIGQASKVLSDYLNQATGEAFGKVKPFSPIKVEHMFGTAFGTSGRDMMAASHWFNPSQDSAPAQFEDTVFLRRYIKDPTRSSDTITRYYQHVAQKTGDYVSAVASYDELVKKRRPADARELYNGLKADQKAYVTLASAGTDDGAAAFNSQDRRIHPMTRAQNALQQLNEVARQIGNNTQANSETGQSFNLTRPQRKAAIEAIHQLGAQEMRNALVMTNEPGYEGRNLLDVNKQYAVIKAISPGLAEEVARRYAMAGVFRTDMVAKNWPAARKELIRSGSDADIADITGDISDEGFEFGAEKIKRPRKLRLQMQGQPAIQ